MSVKKSLPASSIKLIALITMIIDHTAFIIGRKGFTFVPDILGLNVDPLKASEGIWLVCRSVGRIAFPLFCFMLVEGFFHTKSHRRHLILLGLFSLISEIPFDLFFSGKIVYLQHQNTILTLFMAYVGLMILDEYMGDYRFLALLIPLVAELIHTDYGAPGVLTAYLFYVAGRRNGGGLSRVKAPELLADLCPLIISAFSWKVEFCCVLSLPILLLYNGERGRGNKYFFYLVYPLHLWIIYLVRLRM